MARSRPVVRRALAVLLVVGLSACTPEQTIRALFPENGDDAVVVASCESTLDPGAVSPGGANLGLFQINRVHRADFEQVTGQPWSSVFDPFWNTVYARHLYDGQGWRPWTCQP